ncbi:cysteine hydrolase family protein [Amnibacterium sp. CER49]|uniref:cysteine hydrolase family protein n=1 Tax=Amnibacterium sp. CER49 TaxID=3039161 RepID=UPI00244C0F99|nr:cysteine hydrolase family protein [Amnibacterium sp. CER49]MDH2445525.1 cysteine hydrolase family protein [Amnibacterium sp. CER49]
MPDGAALPRRALLVIDVQNEYVSGALPIAYPPLTTSLPKIATAIDAARAAHVPVIVVRHEDEAGSPVFAAGSLAAELHETVASRPSDAVLTKSTVSCFGDTDLAERLEALGVDTLAITGFMTQHCDESTARYAADRGLTVEVLSDATGTLPLTTPAGTISAQELHETSLLVLASGFAAVVTTDEWRAAVARGEPTPAPNLWASTEPARA